MSATDVFQSTMKSRFIATFIISAMVPVIIFLTGCSAISPLSGSGNVITKEMGFSDFTSVEISNGFTAEIIQSDTYNITFTADDNLFPYLKVQYNYSKLKIYLEPFYSLAFSTKRVRITMPSIRALNMSLGSTGTIRGFSSLEDFNLKLSSASRLDGDLQANNTVFKLSAGSSVSLEGSATNMTINGSVGSKAILDNFEVNNADIKLNAVSRASIYVIDQLNADLGTASTLYYCGDPAIDNVAISGGATIKRR